jgi:hypothetical protein
MGLRLAIDHFERETDDGVGEYGENRVFLTFVYRSGTARRAGSSAP